MKTPRAAFRILYSAISLAPDCLGLWTLDARLWTLDSSRRWAVLLAVLWTLPSSSALAQSALGGIAIEIYGMVQVEPGANVVTLGVKKEEIRFVVHNVRSRDQRFSIARFLSDTRHRDPGLYIKGSDELLETLIKERPGKRVLKMYGLYYSDARIFVVSSLEQFHETEKRDF